MAQPQQPAQQPRPAPPPLEALQGTMNGLFTLLGTVLPDPNKRKDPWQRHSIQKLFPDANARFHDALDKLEDDLFKAKAILRRDLAFVRAEKARKEQEAAQNSNPDVVPQITDQVTNGNAAEPVHVDNPVIDEITEDSSAVESGLPKGESPVKSEPQSQPATLSTSDPVQDTSIDTKPESVTSPTEIKDFEFDDLFGDIETSPNAENTVNSIDMADFQSNEHDVPSLLPGLESFANLPDTSLPETSSENVTALDNTVTSLEHETSLENGGLDFSFDGLVGNQADGLGENPADGLGGNQANAESEEQKRQQQQQDDEDFWGDLQTDGDGGLGDDMQVDNSFADMIDFDELGMPEDANGGETGEFDWMVEGM